MGLAMRILRSRACEAFLEELADFRLIVLRMAPEARAVKGRCFHGHHRSMPGQHFSKACWKCHLLDNSICGREPLAHLVHQFSKRRLSKVLKESAQTAEARWPRRTVERGQQVGHRLAAAGWIQRVGTANGLEEER